MIGLISDKYRCYSPVATATATAAQAITAVKATDDQASGVKPARLQEDLKVMVAVP
jgi:hypothetical protein